MKNCPNKMENLKYCTCTYEPCPRKGICCECLRYHLSKKQLPACFFNEEFEKTYDRSIQNFLRMHGCNK